MLDVVGIGVKSDVIRRERWVRDREVAQVEKDQLQTRTQPLREDPWIVHAGANHEARRALSLNPIPEVRAFHLHDSPMFMCPTRPAHGALTSLPQNKKHRSIVRNAAHISAADTTTTQLACA